MLSVALGHTVIGFEINPANLIRVCESLDVNQMGGSASPVAIFQRGVSNVSDQTLRLVVPSNPGMAKMAKSTTTTTTTVTTTTGAALADTTAVTAANTVTTITLDDFADAYNWWEVRPTIALLKIDVEGLEPEVIMGAKRLLQAGLVQHVLTEFRDFASSRAQQAFAILIDNGYVLVSHNVQDGTVIPLTRDATVALWDNYRRGHYPDESWRRIAQTLLLCRSLTKDLWFSRASTMN
jgi:FkbM family methyltransferase